MNYQRILAAYNPDHDLPGAGQPPVTWVEVELAEHLQQLTLTVEQLRAELRQLQAAMAGDDDAR